jgi:hypothetical protein
MTERGLKAVMVRTLRRIKILLVTKNAEYARGDRLSNFKTIARFEGNTPEKALRAMLAKHLVSIYDMVDDLDRGYCNPTELWEEKIDDSIAYLILLKALVAERIEQ